MAKGIDRLLAKKGWTGEEVGKALLASLVHSAQHMNEPDHKPLFSQEDFNRMEESLNTDKEYMVYGVYRDLYGAILDSFNTGQGLYQQFHNGYARIYTLVTECMQSDEAIKEQDESQPLIMTESQYNRYRAKAKAQTEGFTESFISLLFHILHLFISGEAPAPAHIAELIEATKREPVTNKRILSNYNKAHCSGYYQIPNGKRSDQLSADEWRKALAEYQTRNYSYYVNGRKATPEEALEKLRERYQTTAYRLLFYGIDAIRELYREETGKELEVAPDEETLYLQAVEGYLGFEGSYSRRAKEDREAPRGYAPSMAKYSFIEELIEESPLTWHYYDTTPELTKYDTLQITEWYNGDEELNDSTQARDRYKEFKADYPALSSAMEAYIKETVEPLRSYKPTQYYKDAITWKELAELGVGNYRSLLYNHRYNHYDIAEIIDETEGETRGDRYRQYRQYRRAQNGIAILQEPSDYQTDDNGDYAEPESPFTVYNSLDSVADKPQYKELLANCQEGLVKPALRYLFAHNALMDIIGRVYGIPDMDALKLSTSGFERQLQAFNELLYLFYGTVYGNEEEVARKRELIRDLFIPIDTEELKPTEETINAVEETLTGYGFTSTARKELKNFDKLLIELAEGGLEI